MNVTIKNRINNLQKENEVKSVVGVKFEGYSEEDVDKVISRYEGITGGPNTKLVTPIVTVVDFSGSMKKVYNQLKLTIKVFEEKIKTVGKRDLFFILIVIHNSIPRIVFCDSVMMFDADDFICSLPERCAGKTPLAQAVSLADKTLEKLYSALEKQNLWYTIPVHLCITDAITTETDAEYGSIVDKYQEAVTDNEKIVFEFVTQSNKEGLRLGGYRVFVDENNYSKNIGDFMNSLALASTSDKVHEYQFAKRPPDRWSQRMEYNRYMSGIMITNFRNSFENKY